MILQMVRGGLSVGLLITAWRNSHWSVALTLVLTLLACEVLSTMVWQMKEQIAILERRIKDHADRLDAIKDR